LAPNYMSQISENLCTKPAGSDEAMACGKTEPVIFVYSSAVFLNLTHFDIGCIRNLTFFTMAALGYPISGSTSLSGLQLDYLFIVDGKRSKVYPIVNPTLSGSVSTASVNTDFNNTIVLIWRWKLVSAGSVSVPVRITLKGTSGESYFFTTTSSMMNEYYKTIGDPFNYPTASLLKIPMPNNIGQLSYLRFDMISSPTSSASTTFSLTGFVVLEFFGRQPDGSYVSHVLYNPMVEAVFGDNWPMNVRLFDIMNMATSELCQLYPGNHECIF